MHRRVVLLALGGLLGGCRCQPDATVSLTGAGATFPYPLYARWIAEYQRLESHVRINYQPIGSGGGIRQLAVGTIDFGTTEVPVSAEEARGVEPAIVHLPLSIGAVAVAYHVPELPRVRLRPHTLADLFAGRIRRWNAPAVAADNPGVALPDTEVTVVHRTDGSGTTAVFTQYLARVDRRFAAEVGAGKSVRWPVGLGAKGNEGVAGVVKSTPGTVGYVELAYARQNALAVAELENGARRFVRPGPASVAAAVAGVELDAELTASLVARPAEASYPIVAFTYVLVVSDAPEPTKARALARFLWWACHDGQRFARELEYAPLPSTIVERVAHRIETLTARGVRVYPGA